MRSDALWHSLDAENYRTPEPGRPVSADSHSKPRFTIDLPFRYNAGDQSGRSGTGRVLNIGSSEVVVACRHQLEPGTPVELVIEWPAQLDGRIPIHLVMSGRVVRSDISGFAVGACQHRFQLVGNPGQERAAVLQLVPQPPVRSSEVRAEMTTGGRVTGTDQKRARRR